MTASDWRPQPQPQTQRFIESLVDATTATATATDAAPYFEVWWEHRWAPVGYNPLLPLLPLTLPWRWPPVETVEIIDETVEIIDETNIVIEIID